MWLFSKFCCLLPFLFHSFHLTICFHLMLFINLLSRCFLSQRWHTVGKTVALFICCAIRWGNAPTHRNFWNSGWSELYVSRDLSHVPEGLVNSEMGSADSMSWWESLAGDWRALVLDLRALFIHFCLFIVGTNMYLCRLLLLSKTTLAPRSPHGSLRHRFVSLWVGLGMVECPGWVLQPPNVPE